MKICVVLQEISYVLQEEGRKLSIPTQSKIESFHSEKWPYFIESSGRGFWASQKSFFFLVIVMEIMHILKSLLLSPSHLVLTSASIQVHAAFPIVLPQEGAIAKNTDII